MFPPLTKQSWVVSAIILSKLGQGMMLGFTSTLLTALQAPDSPIKLTLASSSWIVATLGLGFVVAYPIGSINMFFFGRRIAFAVCQLPAIAGMLLIYNATDVATLICGRFLAGATSGATSVGATVIGEYCSPQYRGMFLNLKTAGQYLGSLIVHVLGYQVHWRTLALLCIVPFVITLAITYTWPESPFWLAQRRRYSESEEIFYRLRGTTEDSVREIEKLIRTQRDGPVKLKRAKYSIVNLGKKFMKKNFIKPAIVFIFAVITMESCGRHFFPAYMSQIIIKITGNNSHTFYYNTAVDVLLTASALLSSYLIKIMKVRKLLFSTGLLSCILLVLASSYMYLADKDIISKDYPAIPILLFGLYFLMANLGCCTVPLALMGELFPLEHRAVGATFIGYSLMFSMTIILKIIPTMLHNLEVYGTYAVLSLCTAISLLGLYFTLPETKNKTLQEIEHFFNHGQYKADDGRVGCNEDINLQISNESETFVGNKNDS